MSNFEQGFFTTCQVLNQKVWNVWGFESKIPQRVIFWIKSFRKCLILIDEIQKQSEFELKTSKSVKCWKKFVSKVHVDIFVQQNGHILPLCDFQRHDFKKNSLHRIEIFMEKIATCQFLDQNFYNVPNLEMKT